VDGVRVGRQKKKRKGASKERIVQRIGHND
jgi:hypothetical protein